MKLTIHYNTYFLCLLKGDMLSGEDLLCLLKQDMLSGEDKEICIFNKLYKQFKPNLEIPILYHLMALTLPRKQTVFNLILPT